MTIKKKRVVKVENALVAALRHVSKKNSIRWSHLISSLRLDSKPIAEAHGGEG